MKSRKEANHSYYMRRIKQFRKKKVGLDIYSCPFCGMMNNLTRLRDPSLHLQKIYIREGCNWFSPEEYSSLTKMPQLEVFVFQRWEEFMRDTCNKSFKFLKWALNYKLITKERIILEFDLKVIQKASNLENTKSPTKISSSEPFNFSSIIKLFSPGQTNSSRELTNLENSQFLIQSKSIKSLGGISNG